MAIGIPSSPVLMVILDSFSMDEINEVVPPVSAVDESTEVPTETVDTPQDALDNSEASQ